MAIPILDTLPRLTFLLCCLAALPLSAQLTPPNVVLSESVDAINIRVTKQGPYPASISHKSAPFLLFISNCSGTLVDIYSLIQAPASGLPSAAAVTSLLDLHSDLTKQHDFQVIQPLPGHYELHFLSHPAWVVRITITAN